MKFLFKNGFNFIAIKIKEPYFAKIIGITSKDFTLTKFALYSNTKTY